MDIASLRAKLDNIAEELAQLPEQETVAVEEEQVEEVEQPVEEDHHEKDEDGNVIPHDEIEEVAEEEAVEEAMVEIPVKELADIMQLAGYTDYAERIEEYANEPEEQYMDAEEQLIGLSGGLNGPKTMHTPASGGDNPMDKEALKTVEENLYKSYKDFLEEAELTEKE